MTAVIQRIISIFALISAFFSGVFGQYAKQEKKTVFIGHRGYSGVYQENTEEAFRMAGINGFGGCETDVRPTKDGVLVVNHNSDIVFADGTEMVIADHTYEELTAKPIKNRKTSTELYLCTFERYLEIMKQYNMFCFVELKGGYSPADLDTLYNTMVSTYTLDKISVQSGIDNIINLHDIYPDVPVMLCAGGSDEKDIPKALELGFDVDLHMFESAEDWIEKFHAKGLRVAIWTANTPAQVSYALSLGVDFIESDFFSGITTPYV